MAITSGGVDLAGLIGALEPLDAEVRFDPGTRATYSTDSSNYRHVPIGVVLPRTVDAAEHAVRVCSRFDVPVLSRGGGTSLAGQACNEGVVLDWTKYCSRLVSVDEDARTAVVEPGIVLDSLNAQLADRRLMFGPKPATHSHCALGGMIGNNSCGSSAQRYGTTADNVRRLEILTYDGTRMWVGAEEDLDVILSASDPRGDLYRGMRRIAERYADDIRERYPKIPRRVSGYNLDSLLPENGFDVAKALVGSESTLVTVLHAELELVPVPPSRTFVVLGYPTIEDAADAAPTVAEFDPIGIEGIDSVLIGYERTKRENTSALHLLPEGGGYLIVELPGETKEDSDAKAAGMLEALSERDLKPDARQFDEPAHQQEIRDVREAGLGATAMVPGLPDTWEGWEDSAVAPGVFGDYLREFAKLLDEFGYENVARYGHFGHGCLHVRIPFPLGLGAEGVEEYRRFTMRAAELVLRFGGSLSGEHGDGQSRGDLLPLMFGERVIGAFEEFKDLFDPRHRMNPGKVVYPEARTSGLRLGEGYHPKVDVELQFSYPEDQGRFDRAALRCVGVGNCRGHESGVMCPSYRATGEEEHSTRGRARLLFEMLEGQYRTDRDTPISDGWRSNEVKEALDLCLSCKGCRTDCPVDVDMATYKAEFLSHHYAGRLRPVSHYSMGWLALWARLAHIAPGAVNLLSHAPALGSLSRGAAGLERSRPVPRFVRRRFRDRFVARPHERASRRGEVLLWPDTFTDNFHPSVARAAVAVLRDAGYHVRVPALPACCGLTLISTGQLDSARAMLRRTAAMLAPQLAGDVPLLVLEPSCLAVFRSDGLELLADDQNMRTVQEHAVSFAELLERTADWEPPRVDRRVVVQPHCHQHAVLGFAADQRIMKRAGIDARILEGCCGLAGNFGFEPGHLPVSVGVAEHALLPALRAEPSIPVIADGFSCRTQADQLGRGPRALHLAELLAEALPNESFRATRTRRDRVAQRIQDAALGALPGRKS